MVAHTCILFHIMKTSLHIVRSLFKIPRGAGNLVQTPFIKLVWVNSWLPGGVTKPLRTFLSCLFVCLDF